MVDEIKKQIQRVKHYFYDSHPELPIDPDVVQPGHYRRSPHFTPQLLIVVFVGGCLGAYARYLIEVSYPTPAGGFPAATTFVNLLGAFALGFLLETLARLGEDNNGWRLARLGIGTGFCGGFTTFSTASFEIARLLEEHRYRASIFGIVFSVGSCLLAGFARIALFV